MKTFIHWRCERCGQHRRAAVGDLPASSPMCLCTGRGCNWSQVELRGVEPFPAVHRVRELSSFVINDPIGQKDDAAKLRYDLFPWETMAPILRVLAFGARKHGDHNWRSRPDGAREHFAAAMRHLVKHQLGELADPDTGESHLAHAACRLLFLVTGAPSPSSHEKQEGDRRRVEGANSATDALLDTLGGRP